MAESADKSQQREQEEIHTILLSQSCAYIPKETGVLSGYAQNSATFKPLAGETKEDSNRRYKAYTNTWGHIKQCIDELLSRQHNTLLGEVIQFVETAKKQWIDVAKSDHQSVILPSYLTMIPTGSIILGIVYAVVWGDEVLLWAKHLSS